MDTPPDAAGYAVAAGKLCEDVARLTQSARTLNSISHWRMAIGHVGMLAECLAGGMECAALEQMARQAKLAEASANACRQSTTAQE